MVGYALGRLDLIQKTFAKGEVRVVQTTETSSKQNLQKGPEVQNNTPEKEPSKISIDESKFVVEIKTDSFQKDFDNLGEKTVSEDSINSSVSKLSQLKRNT